MIQAMGTIQICGGYNLAPSDPTFWTFSNGLRKFLFCFCFIESATHRQRCTRVYSCLNAHIINYGEEPVSRTPHIDSISHASRLMNEGPTLRTSRNRV